MFVLDIMHDAAKTSPNTLPIQLSNTESPEVQTINPSSVDDLRQVEGCTLEGLLVLPFNCFYMNRFISCAPRSIVLRTVRTYAYASA